MKFEVGDLVYDDSISVTGVITSVKKHVITVDFSRSSGTEDDTIKYGRNHYSISDIKKCSKLEQVLK